MKSRFRLRGNSPFNSFPYEKCSSCRKLWSVTRHAWGCSLHCFAPCLTTAPEQTETKCYQIKSHTLHLLFTLLHKCKWLPMYKLQSHMTQIMHSNKSYHFQERSAFSCLVLSAAPDPPDPPPPLGTTEVSLVNSLYRKYNLYIFVTIFMCLNIKSVYNHLLIGKKIIRLQLTPFPLSVYHSLAAV